MGKSTHGHADDSGIHRASGGSLLKQQVSIKLGRKRAGFAVCVKTRILLAATTSCRRSGFPSTLCGRELEFRNSLFGPPLFFCHLPAVVCVHPSLLLSFPKRRGRMSKKSIL